MLNGGLIKLANNLFTCGQTPKEDIVQLLISQMTSHLSVSTITPTQPIPSRIRIRVGCDDSLIFTLSALCYHSLTSHDFTSVD